MPVDDESNWPGVPAAEERGGGGRLVGGPAEGVEVEAGVGPDDALWEVGECGAAEEGESSSIGSMVDRQDRFESRYSLGWRFQDGGIQRRRQVKSGAQCRNTSFETMQRMKTK